MPAPTGASLADVIDAAGEADRYVSKSGNDSWDGTAPAFVSGSTGPWLTVGKALDDAATNGGGRKIHVRTGTYSENLTKTIAGLISKTTTITNYQGEAVVIQPLYTTLNGDQLSNSATLTVADTTGYSTSGTIRFYDVLGGMQVVAYTGKTSTTFTGCTGGSAVTAKSGRRVHKSGSGFQLLNSAFVRVVGQDWNLIIDGKYCRPTAADNNAVFYVAGTSHDVYLEEVIVQGGHDHSIFCDPTTSGVVGDRFILRDNGSPMAVGESIAKSAAGTGLGAGTHFFKVQRIYESGAIGTNDGTTTAHQMSITIVAGDKITLNWADKTNRNGAGWRIFRHTANINNGQVVSYYDVPEGTVTWDYTGQAADGTLTFSTSNVNKDHSLYVEGSGHCFTNFVIEGNDFGNALQIYGDADAVTVANYTIVDTAYEASSSAYRSSSVLVGTDLGGANRIDNCVIKNGIIKGGKRGIEGYGATSISTTLSSSYTAGATTMNLTSAGSFPTSGRVKVMKDGLNGDATSIWCSYSGKSGNQLTGVVTLSGSGTANSGIFVFGSTTPSGTGNVADYNLQHGNTRSDELQWPQGTPNENSYIITFTNGVNADPLFTDYAGGDYTLQAGSPAIDTGDPDYCRPWDILGNERALVDLGAYAYSIAAAGGGGPTVHRRMQLSKLSLSL